MNIHMENAYQLGMLTEFNMLKNYRSFRPPKFEIVIREIAVAVQKR